MVKYVSYNRHPVREIIRNNGWSKSKVDEMFFRLDNMGKV